MPRSIDRKALYLGLGEAWNMVAELLGATAVWGLIGYGLDRLFGTGPILLALGAALGHATGIYIVIKKPTWRAQARKDRESEAK